MKVLTHFSLFSGIGGLDLAAEWAGFTTVGQCEWADYPTKILEKNWPDVPRWRDIRSLTYENFREQTGLGTVDIISGGFPCQPFSVAGKQKGKDDDRYLWPEMLRVIRELAPSWVIGENVPGILRIAGKTVCEDLEREGYAVTVFNFEAAAVGASHRRERVFFVGERTTMENTSHSRCKQQGILSQQQRRAESFGTGKGCSEWASSSMPEDVADAIRRGRQQNRKRGSMDGISGAGANNTMPSTQSGADVAVPCGERETERGNEGFQQTASLKGTGANNRRGAQEYVGGEWWPVESGLGMLANGLSYWLGEYLRVEPDIPRVATGVKNRVDQLKCYGNAVVPQQAYPIFKAIAEIERSFMNENNSID